MHALSLCRFSRPCHRIVLHRGDDQPVACIKQPMDDVIQAEGYVGRKYHIALPIEPKKIPQLFPGIQYPFRQIIRRAIAASTHIEARVLNIFEHGLTHTRSFRERCTTVIQVYSSHFFAVSSTAIVANQ